MSGTSALLNLLEGSGSALLNAPETTKNGVSDSDSSYFVSLMKQYEVAEGPEDKYGLLAKETETDETELLGNGLPMLPAGMVPATDIRMPVLPAAVEIEADTRLEEFAVGLGIDRELARLLLRETSVSGAMGEVVSGVKPLETPVSPGTLSNVPLAPAATSVTTLRADPVPASPTDTLSPLRGDTGIAIEAPVVVPRLEMAQPALRDEDVLRLRASIHRSSTPIVEPRREIVPPAVAEAVSVVEDLVDPMLATPRRGLSEQDFAAATASLRGFALERRQELSAPVRSSTPIVEPRREIVPPAVAEAVSVVEDLVDPMLATPRRGLSEQDFAAATASLRGFALERRQTLTTTVTSVSAMPPLGDSPVNPILLPADAVAPVAAATAVSASFSNPLAAQADSLTTPLRVPDPTLQHELRAEQFAEQVGRRMLQQIREDRWTVNLQLDPQRLGPMEIELQLEGNQVTAQVGVSNAEVRQLLESALPKLRESLDSAGLNLANWSFAQSGARDYREFAQRSAVEVANVTSTAAEAGNKDGMSRSVSEDSASRVVDVYV